MVQNNNEDLLITLDNLRQWTSQRKENGVPVFYNAIKSDRNKIQFEEIMKSKLSNSDLFVIINLIINLAGKPSKFCKCPLIINCIISDEFFDRVFSFLNASIKSINRHLNEVMVLINFYESIIHYLPICSKGYEKTYTILQIIFGYVVTKSSEDCAADACERVEELLNLLKGKEYLFERNNFCYSEMDIYPSAVDLFENHSVSSCIIDGPYNDSKQYLDINFKLLKEDFIHAIKEEFEALRSRKKKGLNFNSSIFLYEDVISKKIVLKSQPKSKICHILEFSHEDVAILSNENWDISKKFMNGSLLFFSRNNFTTFTVATVEDNFWAYTNGRCRSITVSIIGDPNKIKINTPYTMVEPMNFFEPYYQSLKVLQGLNPHHLPLGENFILASNEEIPLALVHKSPLYSTSTNLLCYEENDLNKSQNDALNKALSRKFTLIQGPPGTGKSYLTRKIIKVLAADSSDIRPILVLSMRNKALDIILEPLVTSGMKVIRFGRTESDILDNFTLYNWKVNYWGRCKDACCKFLRKTIKSFRQIINNPDKHQNRAIQDAFESHKEACDAFRLHADYFDGYKIKDKNIKVIGATTTGAAKRNAMINEINPKAVIIEEAAEIMEPFLISSLPSSCEHLILIGDHMQLQPITASHNSVKYNLNISFFERMILNGKEYHQLNVQHRMRPEIADLIYPLIYDNVTNHPSVYKFPDIVGIGKNIFFVDHSANEEFKNHSKSYFNPYEANFLLSLANYLVQQGYSSKDISILASYSAQQIYLIQHHYKYPLLSGIHIQSIDNYQGCENKIILLSLVRSNGPTIGFLSKSNRINVALTRAKMGLYIIGNMKTLSKHSNLWKDIDAKLKINNSIGKEIPLKCKRHNRITKVSKPEQINTLSSGHCLKMCHIHR